VSVSCGKEVTTMLFDILNEFIGAALAFLGQFY
jgi:hypothetical protein